MATQDATALLGQTVGGRYRLTAFVGEGAMASVYRAEADGFAEPIAVKILHDTAALHEHARDRFEREAKAASLITHPGSVRILDWGADRGRLFMAMEFVEGESLFRLLRRHEQLPQAVAVRIALRVCEVLEAAHEQSVIHRDLKPENIMVLPASTAEDMRIKVLDFGIAKIVVPEAGEPSSAARTEPLLTRPGSALGTPTHMAPEQIRGETVGPRTDLYVLGVVLYEMLTGRLPFEGDNPTQVLIDQVRERPLQPTVLREDLAPELERLVLTCLEKRPEARCASAGELKARLQALLPALQREDDLDFQPAAGVIEDQVAAATVLPSSAGAADPRGTSETRIAPSEPAVAAPSRPRAPALTAETRLAEVKRGGAASPAPQTLDGRPLTPVGTTAGPSFSAGGRPVAPTMVLDDEESTDDEEGVTTEISRELPEDLEEIIRRKLAKAGLTGPSGTLTEETTEDQTVTQQQERRASELYGDTSRGLGASRPPELLDGAPPPRGRIASLPGEEVLDTDEDVQISEEVDRAVPTVTKLMPGSEPVAEQPTRQRRAQALTAPLPASAEVDEEDDDEEDYKLTELMDREALLEHVPDALKRPRPITANLPSLVEDEDAEEAGPEPGREPGPATQMLESAEALLSSDPAARFVELQRASPLPDEMAAPVDLSAAPPHPDDDLDELLRRMPRTGHPVLSTTLAVLIIVAILAGVTWLLLFSPRF